MVDNGRKTPEDIEKELSVGNFVGVQAKTMGFQIAGLAGGLGLAYAANKIGLGKWIGKKATPLINAAHPDGTLITNSQGAGNWIVTGAGAFVGMLTGGMASLYEHWSKVERERLNIQEANRDIASVMESRVKFENTLNQQSELVKSMLEKQEAMSNAGFTSKEAARSEERASAEIQR